MSTQPRTRPLTDNQLEVLRQFGSETGWLRPLDLGGSNRSNHSAVLAQLQRRGLVDSKVRSHGVRGSKLYRITPAGRHALLTRTTAVNTPGGVEHGGSESTPQHRPTTAARCRALADQLETAAPTKASNYRQFADALDHKDMGAICAVSASINHTVG